MLVLVYDKKKGGSMPGPITHIVLAEKVFSEHFASFSEGEFFIGASFPDIRNIVGNIKKEAHPKVISFDCVKRASSAFQAGWLFHSFVDQLRNTRENKLYAGLPNLKHFTASMKLFEDECLYGKIDFWGPVVVDLDEILLEELEFDSVSKVNIRKWHSMLQDYFSEKPNKKTRRVFFKEGLGFSEDEMNIVEKNIAKLKNDKIALNIVENFYKGFEELLEK